VKLQMHSRPRAGLDSSHFARDLFRDVAHEHYEPPSFITRCKRWLDTGEETARHR
jgi:hypothetical protein